MPRTKIVCTIGPASASPAILAELARAGMDVTRLNFSHGRPSGHLRVITAARRLAATLKRPLAILQDLAGPKVRIGPIQAGRIVLKSGDRFTLTDRKVPGDSHMVSVSYPGLSREVSPGDSLLLSDGALELEVMETDDHDIRCRVVVGGELSSYKGLNLPSRSLKIPCLTKKDRQDLEFGLEHGVDFVALSFVRNADDVMAARHFIKKRKKEIPVIAKIEKHEALKNIDDILEAADGIMIARGDLGVEIPLERIPLVQKTLIRKANRSGKLAITATQMLKSMVDNPRPTRAEVTDVANAILDGTDAVMLSEETAVGKYPVRAVEMMRLIAEDAETGFPYSDWPSRLDQGNEKNWPEAVSFAAVNLAAEIGAAAIVSITKTGSTARLTAKYRPRQPIIAATPLKETFRRLALVWGVEPILIRRAGSTDQLIQIALDAARKAGYVSRGQEVVITAGVTSGAPVETPGRTNLIKIEVLK
ncbi:MAG: Pyruvate kinase [Candidatus Saccharicenans subterraneus]|uniref:Pyruvate kinase n=1 Tax=Candidatus Saccharicenans subterraneus TaxID=2508984 RepID=A0A3E2BJ89_9BACT|nr:MAG: Pyruvate kinase [Candidatus Saccharicenans subterraneum]